MIKSISPITNIGRKATMTALFAGLMTLGAGAAKLNNQNANTTTPTELVSKEAAAAMRANAISPQATTQTVPTTHNVKLDNTLRKFIETEEDKTYIEGVINKTYAEKGLYLGSAIIQNEIDVQNLYMFMTVNTKFMKEKLNPELGKKIESFGSEFSKTILPNEKAMTEWVLDKYVPYISQVLTFDHKPTAKEVDDRFDEIIKKIGFNRDNIIDFHVYSDGFVKNKLHNNKTQQNLADYIAYKMFLIDRMMMAKAMNKSNIFNIDSFVKDLKGVYEYYVEWMEAAQPKGE